VSSDSGTPIFTHFMVDETMTTIYSPAIRIGILDFQDLSAIDRRIKQIIEGKYSFEQDFERYSTYTYLAQ